jgi:NADH dehydrogenase FAD-containing subunit
MATNNICEQRVGSDHSRRRFGGLRTAQALKSDLFDVTLIGRRNYHLYHLFSIKSRQVRYRQERFQFRYAAC